MKSFRNLLIAFVALAAALPAWAQSIGRVLVASGEVTLVRGAATQPATAGLTLQAGDRVRTGAAGTAQLWFTDSSVVALRSGTDFVVEQYRFDNSPADNLVFNLVRGGFRTVAGLIGIKEQKSYVIKTRMATLGRRGTQFGILYCERDCPLPEGGLAPDGLYGGVYDGRVGVANNTPEVQFGRDEYFYVASINSIPQPLLGPPSFFADRLAGLAKNAQKPASEPPPSKDKQDEAPQDSPAEAIANAVPYTATENRSASGTPTVTGSGTQFPNPRAFLLGIVMTNPSGVQVGQGGGRLNPPSLLVGNVNGSPAMVQFTGTGITGAVGPSGIDMRGSDAASGIIWGRWIDATVAPITPSPTQPSAQVVGTGVHYIYGAPTVDTVIAAKSGFFTSSDIGGTTPVTSSGQLATAFSFGLLDLDFTSRSAILRSVSATFPTSSWSFSNLSYSFVFNDFGGTGVTFRGNQTNVGTCTGTGCGPVQGPNTANAQATGIFFGPNGERIGLSFHGMSGGASTNPNLGFTTVRIFAVQPSPPLAVLFANSLTETNGSSASYNGAFTTTSSTVTFNGVGPTQTITAFNFPQATFSGAVGGSGIDMAGFDADSGVYYGRWIAGTITTGAQQPSVAPGTQTSGMGVHYMYGTPTADSVIAAKTGTAQYVDYVGTTPTASNGQTSPAFTLGPININFTNRTGVITSVDVSFPTSFWQFANLPFNINVTPGQGANFDANLIGAGSCVGSGCGPVQGSNTARADFFGRFVGSSGNFLGLSFQGNSGGNSPSGNPNLVMGFTRLFKCPSC